MEETMIDTQRLFRQRNRIECLALGSALLTVNPLMDLLEERSPSQLVNTLDAVLKVAELLQAHVISGPDKKGYWRLHQKPTATQ